MEINGVTFRDYACASANLVAGLPVEKICEVLGMELPVWEDTQNQWNHKMAELSMDDMKFYAEVFSNPKQGKFANVEGAVSGEEALTKVPDIDTFAKIMEHMSVAEDFGVDSAPILEKEYNLTFVEWSKASGHYSQLLLKASEDQQAYDDYYAPHNESSEKWNAYFKDFYKDKGTDLASDIDF